MLGAHVTDALRPPPGVAGLSTRRERLADDDTRKAVFTERLPGLDVVRVFASLTVIWHHAVRTPGLNDHDSLWFGTWGTSFFNFLAGFLLVSSILRRPEQTYGSFASHRFMRLYVPFLVWAGIGLLARIPNSLLLHNTTSTQLSVHILWHGATYHLWFLPYVLVASLIAYLPTRAVLRSVDRAGLAALAISLGAVALVALTFLTPVAVTMQEDHSFGWLVAAGHFVRRFPLFVLGISFGLLVLAVPSVLQWVRRLTPVSLAVALTAIFLRQVFGTYPALTVRVGALAAFMFGLGYTRSDRAPLLARLGRYSFGVYLCHFLFVEGAIAVSRAAGLAPSWPLDLAVFGLAAVGSFTLVFLLKQDRRTAWLIP